jgi:mono/diheme cytochrome c family protein
VPTRPSFLVKFLCRVAWKPYPFPDKPIAPPPAGDKVAMGRYLTHQLGCFACHSADFKKLDELNPEKSLGYLGGGNKLLDMSGQTIVAPNITFDAETGIGKWTEEQFVRALREGFKPDGAPLRYPMVKAPSLAPAEASAIYAYLKSAPVIRNPRPPEPARPELRALSDGERVYLKYQCHSCHGLTGVGLADLRNADKKYPKDEALKAWIQKPSKIKPNTKMPDWDGVIADAEYTPLMAFVRKLGQKAATETAAQ